MKQRDCRWCCLSTVAVEPSIESSPNTRAERDGRSSFDVAKISNFRSAWSYFILKEIVCVTQRSVKVFAYYGGTKRRMWGER